jgi:hypothetical protein
MPMHDESSAFIKDGPPPSRIDGRFNSRDCPRPGESEDPLERRIVPRSVALEFRSWIGWWSDSEFVVAPARLLDISQGGVAVEAGAAPSIHQEVWFCLDPVVPASAVGGEVVRLDRGKRYPHLIRVAFWSPCPAELHRWALDGVRPAAAHADGLAQQSAHTQA